MLIAAEHTLTNESSMWIILSLLSFWSYFSFTIIPQRINSGLPNATPLQLLRTKTCDLDQILCTQDWVEHSAKYASAMYIKWMLRTFHQWHHSYECTELHTWSRNTTFLFHALRFEFGFRIWHNSPQQKYIFYIKLFQ